MSNPITKEKGISMETKTDSKTETKQTASKEGRRPIATRRKPLFNEDVFGNPLLLSEDLQKELADQNLVGRFIDAKRLHEMNGYHDKSWVPYKRDASKAIKDTHGFKFGNDPDGVIRRGSLILAVKTKEQVALHREFLDQKASRATNNFNAKKAQELREFSKGNRLRADVHEGYEENEDE